MIDYTIQFRGPFMFLSNFYPCTVKYKGITYNSSEAAYMSAKQSSKQWKEFCRTHEPGQIKRASHQIKNLRVDWPQIKLKVMEEVLRIKFADDRLAQLLINTQHLKLEEGNTWGDKFWGVDKITRDGENHLGKILMKIRKDYL